MRRWLALVWRAVNGEDTEELEATRRRNRRELWQSRRPDRWQRGLGRVYGGPVEAASTYPDGKHGGRGLSIRGFWLSSECRSDGCRSRDSGKIGELVHGEGPYDPTDCRDRRWERCHVNEGRAGRGGDGR